MTRDQQALWSGVLANLQRLASAATDKLILTKISSTLQQAKYPKRKRR